MRTLFAAMILLLIAFFSASHSDAEIKTEKDALAFLNKYCLELVFAIEDQYEEQKVLATEKKWEELFKRGSLIEGMAEIYSNLCK